MKTYQTFEQAFVSTIKELISEPETITSSRNGQMHEKLGFSFKILDASSYVFENENFGRIPYQYASDFYEWMVSSEENATEVFAKKYPAIKGFLEKPKSKNLPDNFNALYGPRIKRQLPLIIEELQSNENSRRAVISILSEGDLSLFKADEDPNLEFPCCDSAAFNVRNNKLHMNLHMRSNNMGNVAKLDMYLWGRLMSDINETLGTELGTITYTVVSAHIFTSDFNYFLNSGIIREVYHPESDLQLTINAYKVLANKLMTEISEKNVTMHGIRHAKTKNNIDRIYQGGKITSDISILALGPDTFIPYSGLLIDTNAAYCSSYNRTFETLLHLMHAKHVTENIILTKSPLLNEFDLGALDGAIMSTTEDQFLQYLAEHHITGHIKFHSMGESIFEVFDRICKFLHQIAANHEKTNILVIGHGVWFGCLNVLLGKSDNILLCKPSNLAVFEI